MESFENIPPQERTREPEHFPNLDTAEYNAERYVFRFRIDPDSFVQPYGPYSRDEVQKDNEYVRKREQQFAEDKKDRGVSGNRQRERLLQRLGSLYEAIVLDNIADNGWFGDTRQTETIIPSKFDDIANGIDGAINFPHEEDARPLALAFDVTTSENIAKKVARIKEEIERGKLARMKYFESEQTGEKRAQEQMPRVVIGADRKSIQQLLTYWNDRQMAALAQHPMQLQVLKEIETQLRTYEQYARQCGQDEAAHAYQRDLEIVQNILNEKTDSESEYGFSDAAIRKMEREIKEDLVYKAITNELTHQFPEEEEHSEAA